MLHFNRAPFDKTRISVNMFTYPDSLNRQIDAIRN